MIQCNVFILV